MTARCCLCFARGNQEVEADETTGWPGAPLCRDCQVDCRRQTAVDRAKLAAKLRPQIITLFEPPQPMTLEEVSARLYAKKRHALTVIEGGKARH